MKKMPGGRDCPFKKKTLCQLDSRNQIMILKSSPTILKTFWAISDAAINKHQQSYKQDGSSGPVVMGGDTCFKGLDQIPAP